MLRQVKKYIIVVHPPDLVALFIRSLFLHYLFRMFHFLPTNYQFTVNVERIHKWQRSDLGSSSADILSDLK